MLSYRILSFSSFLAVFSLGYMIGEFFVRKVGKENDITFLKYARIVLFVISLCTFIWLLFNKELFHWNFDIATGEPVDHYSTYGMCIRYTVSAFVCNIIGFIVAKKKTISN